MKKETITRIKLTASEGHILTNGAAYGKVIYLGVNDSPDNWHEITEEEYQKTLEDNEIIREG
jgi:hypothetical protein